MIIDARVLQPEFVPRDIVHRDRETRELSKILKPAINDHPTENIFLFGPTGAGKSCIAQFTTDRLRQARVDITIQYINCWEDYTRFKTLYRILEGINQAYDIHRQSTPRDELLERLKEYSGPPYIIILDEVDQLEDTDVLYDLYRISGLSMIMIANHEKELFAHLDQRVQSRLQNRISIKFESYRHSELVSILQDRVHWGLAEDAISKNGIDQIAEAASGDARVAIGILRNAAQKTDREGLDQIPTRVIESVIPEAKTEIKQSAVDRLNEDQRVLYETIREYESITPGELYQEYEQRVEATKTKRMVRNYLSKMQHYNLIIAEGNTRGRTYRLVS